MDFMTKYDVRLVIKEKAVLIPNGLSSYRVTGHSLSSYFDPAGEQANAMVLEDDDTDSHSDSDGESILTAILSSSDSSSSDSSDSDSSSDDSSDSSSDDDSAEQQLLTATAANDSSQPPAEACDSADMNSEQPNMDNCSYGIFPVNDSDSDIEYVDQRTYEVLCTAFRDGKLDWATYCTTARREPQRSDVDGHKRWTDTKSQLHKEAALAGVKSSKSGPASSSRRLVLFSDDQHRWSPAAILPNQSSTARFKIRRVRGKKDLHIDSSLVVGFKLSRLNSGNGKTVKPLKLKANQCQCCFRPKPSRDTDTDSMFCRECQTLVAGCIKNKQDIDAFVAAAKTSDEDRETRPAEADLEEAVMCHLDFEGLTEAEVETTSHLSAKRQRNGSSRPKRVNLRRLDQTLLHANLVIDQAKQQWDSLKAQVNKEAGINADNVDDYLKQKYPIDLSEIGTCVPEYKAWLQKVFDQEICKLKCFDKLLKWAPAPWAAKLKIRVKPDSVPAKVHKHTCPVHLRDELKKFHEDLYERGFIEPIYDCEHLSPVVLVKKPTTADGKSRGYRMVVNMIARNATLEPIANRLPECTEIFMALKGAKYLACFDLENGYWNVALDEKSKRLTAFGSEMGSWCWKCLPQGMVSSGPYFQAWCERLFRKYNVLAPQHGFADLDSQFEEVRLSREADRVAQEQREDGRENAAETTAKADESKAAIKKHLVDAKKLRWTGAGFLYQYLDDSFSWKPPRRKTVH